MSKYDFKKIEAKWQKEWAKGKYKIWAASDSGKEKFYDLVMFPYPSGEGLHVGHVEGYTAADIIARYLRMKGKNVLHPMGWDAFGLPAENFAIKTKTHPSVVVKNNVANFAKQLRSLGLSYDWSREVNTTDPEYYKWTQWIFLQLFKKGLAYEAEIPVNWCPKDKTVLANEEVIDGCCERCGTQVEHKKLKQWLLKITAYADRLLEDLKDLEWPERVKEMQRNWIGRSEGAILNFQIKESDFSVPVFTTRPDTLAGATYLVLAPEHPFVTRLLNDGPNQPLIKNLDDVEKYIFSATKKSERERLAEVKDKTGIALEGVMAVNPLTKKEIPVWISDYVLAHYGTGAIMAVPAHDERDYEFAKKFGLPITEVVKGLASQLPYLGNGTMVNSGHFDGTDNIKAKEEIIHAVGGQKTVNYKLRDWIFSRQRYWGEPIPIIKCPTCGNVPVPEKDLPVELPKVENYEPTGKTESPLASIDKWVNVKCPQCQGEAKRETNTMPQWAGSCWYYLRYLDSQNKKALLDSKKEQYWMPVDLYIGGVEHAVLHLLYARFWHKVLFDLRIVSTKEPFIKLVNQGLILGADGQKMSKSRGNVVNPDDLIKEFGADSLRLYEMFMGPLEDAKPWDPRGIVGVYRFLNRVYMLVTSDKVKGKNTNLERLLHKTIKKVTGDIGGFRLNTAISALMILLNEMEKNEELNTKDLEQFIKLLFPFAPHLAQECWQQLGQKGLLDYEPWPGFDESLIEETTFDLVVQINGRVRAVVKADKDISQAEAEKLAQGDEVVRKWLTGPAKKVIFVPNRLINFIL